MAAYAALVSLMHLIEDIEHHPHPPISMDKKQVESLIEIVTFLQEFLQHYTFSVADDDEEADPLEMRITKAAYAAEDIIESYIVDVIKLSRSTTIHDQGTGQNDSGEKSRSISGEENDSGKESRSFSEEESRSISCEESKFGFDEENGSSEETTISSGEEMKCGEEVNCINLHQVIEEMDLIKKVAMEIDAENAASPSVALLASSSSSTWQSNSSMMVCSDDVLFGTMEKLVGGELDRQVLPVVGMGGIGKMTLAKTLYSNLLIKEHFDICGWATISQRYNTRDILCELFSQTTNKNKDELSESSEDELGSKLYKYLSGRRFLVVMDDMWNIDAWDEIQHFFPNNENGSRILVTTRLSQLSSQLNNSYSLQMEFLDEFLSWDLFCKTVFGEESCPLEMVEIGKKNVKNCRGLPLSIVVVGGLLKKLEQTHGCWESIRNNLTSIVNLENDKHCLRLLKLSYNHLPVYLKSCFLYVGVLKEDCAIRVSRLIRLWVSEGFLKSVNGKSLETIAKGFLQDLVDRNLILIDELGCTGNIKCCKIHDLVRDLCLRESRKYGFYHIIGQDRPQGMNRQRRVVILGSTSEQKVLDAMSHNTRSVICCGEGKVRCCQNFGLLRILYTYEKHSHQSYAEAFEFRSVNLRHLTVSGRGMSAFLSSLDLIWNLQTLIVESSGECDVPVGIWKMPQLRHIEVNGSCRLPNPPSNGRDDVAVLKNLRVLMGSKNFKCDEEMVMRIPNVTKLKIGYWDRDDDYYLSNIGCLYKLESVHIHTSVAPLHKLTFPSSLKSLSVHMNRKFEWEDILEKISWLPLLEKLRLLCGCFGRGKWEIAEGQFPSLKHLDLSWCVGLKHWTAQESSIFPHLEKLHLKYLQELKEIPSEIGRIPTLRNIRLDLCSESAVISAKDIVDEQMYLQGELPFYVEAYIWSRQETLQSLAGPNFKLHL